MGVQWMHWNVASAIAFVCMFGLIVGLNVWHSISPGYARKGFLPMPTTRGERVFLALLVFFGTSLLWLAFMSEFTIYWSLLISGSLVFIITRWG